MLRKCKSCKRTWAVSVLALPVKHYTCPMCEKKEGEALKHGRKPTRAQNDRIKSLGLRPENWLVTKDCSECLEVVNRISGKTRKLNLKWSD